MDMKLEVFVVPVSDVDRAKHFYQSLGFRMDIDRVIGNERVVQFTPPGASASIHIGKGLTTAAPGSATLMLTVSEVDAARQELIGRGAQVSEVFHAVGGSYYAPINRVAGPDPERRSYFSFVSFSDPDGNRWLLQELTTRLPGRGLSHDAATLAGLLHEAEKHHGDYEPTAPKHHWSEWYAAYIIAREQGASPEVAAKGAGLHVESLLESVPGEVAQRGTWKSKA